MAWKSTLEEYPEHVQAIGMISIENANLEIALADLLSASLHVSRRTGHAIYFTARASALRIEIMQSAVKSFLWPDDTADAKHELAAQKKAAWDRVEHFAKRAYGVVNRRHAIIHDAWGVLDTEGEEAVFRQAVGKTLDKAAQKQALEPLLDLIRDFRALIDEVHELTAAFRKRPPYMADMKKS